MEKIILDFTGAKNWMDIYDVMKKAFNFPYKWGNNLDALFDAMRYYWDEDTCLVIKGLDKVSSEWRPYMDDILGVFQRVHDETPNVTFIIES